MKFFTVLFLMALTFFGITFSIQNASLITLSYYNFFNFQIPAYVLAFGSILIGVVFAGLIGLFERMKLSRKLSRLKKEIKALEAEIYEIRRMQMQNSGGPPIKNEYLS